MASDSRYVYGSRPLGALVPGITRPSYRRHGPATAQILADWEAIVGPAIAAITTPKRFSAGTLTIGCIGPIAMELQYVSGELISRINGHVGRQLVSQLRFVQTDHVAPVTRAPGPTAADDAAVNKAVAPVPDGDLRRALAALGKALRIGAKPST